MSKMLIPENIDEAICMLNHENRIACAGATNLYVDRQKGKYLDYEIVSLHKLDALKQITRQDDGWHIGSLVTFNELEQFFMGKGAYDALSKASSEVGSPQIRHRGTIGGNIISASPAADSVPVLMVLDAQLVLRSVSSERCVPLNGFMKGPGKTAIKENELLTEIVIPDKNGKAVFRKLGKRNALAISIINIAIYTESYKSQLTNLQIAIGSAGPTAKRAVHTEDYLLKCTKPVSEQEWLLLKEDVTKTLALDIAPINDIRATGSYRQTVANNLVIRLIRQLWEDQ